MSKTVRRNLSNPADWWAAFEEAAEAEQLSLSEWMAESCIPWLDIKTQKSLSQRPKVGKPKATQGNE